MSVSNETPALDNQDRPAEHRHDHKGKAVLGVTALVILTAGAVAGAGAVKLTGPTVEMAPMTPVAISSVQDWSLVTVKGKVAEVFGNKFVMQDDSGRALVETGRAGEGGKLVAVNEAVTVQGRFENGFLHATYLVRQDGTTQALRPAGGPPPHGPLDEVMHHFKP